MTTLQAWLGRMTDHMSSRTCHKAHAAGILVILRVEQALSLEHCRVFANHLRQQASRQQAVQGGSDVGDVGRGFGRRRRRLAAGGRQQQTRPASSSEISVHAFTGVRFPSTTATARTLFRPFCSDRACSLPTPEAPSAPGKRHHSPGGYSSFQRAAGRNESCPQFCPVALVGLPVAGH